MLDLQAGAYDAAPRATEERRRADLGLDQPGQIGVGVGVMGRDECHDEVSLAALQVVSNCRSALGDGGREIRLFRYG